VAVRAFEDIKPGGNRAGLTKTQDPSPAALAWVRGDTLSEHRYDQFMSFANICDVLGWPHALLVEYAECLSRDAAHEFFARHPTINYSSQGYAEREVSLGELGFVGHTSSLLYSYVRGSGPQEDESADT
jgi:hypothetical protein